MSNMVDIETQPVIDVWGGGAVRARKIDGERATLSVVELAANAVVPGHRHENEQLGMVITGSITFTIGDERRELGPGGTWRIPSHTPHQASSRRSALIGTTFRANPRRRRPGRGAADAARRTRQSVALAAGETGSANPTMAPPPSLAPAQIRPPSASTMSLARASPMPRPSAALRAVSDR